ncbi:extracellular solute-binding protein [Paenibacillus rhizovicinus]|uniref:Extracellular solute-binding protein n=1 Tax=Paenibacillus rhizovicinus TaxID=2704463 RepID=A0A6C0NXQ1_9BACL|nr:extracellular solute-binding protein [Paenibacillus rhizovicinus]QHW31025.1 extracellular solute-binding protein [Paenibacillus rhizovicinus]
MRTRLQGRDKARAVVFAFLALILAALLLGGCMNNADANADQSEQKTIVIGIHDKGAYYSSYGDFISAAFPDLKVELVEMDPDYAHPIAKAQYEQKLKDEKPDLLVGYDIRYKQLAADGLLTDLTTRMMDSKMKEDDFYPGMFEKLKRDGDGSLFAVSPILQASVLYYNADLFRKYNIPLPQNGMTMTDVMQLASQFARAGSNKDGIVGYHQPLSSMPNNLLYTLSYKEGNAPWPYNFQTGKVTVDTPAWRSIIKTVIDLYKNGTFKMQDIKGESKDGEVWYGPDAVSEADLFKQGKSALTIASYNEMNGMPFEVGSVTPPVSPVDNRSSDMGIYNYMAIPAGAEHADTAWEVTAFMLSDYMAKVRSGLQDQYVLPTRKSYMKYDHNPILPQLYEILPSIDQSYPNEGYDPKFMPMFNDLEDREITAAVNGEKSVEAAIATMQKEGQALMDAAKPKK